MGVYIAQGNFSAPNNQGWTENIALVPSTLTTGLIASVVDLFTRRLDWLSQDCALTKLEIRNLDSPRDVFLPPAAVLANGAITENCNLADDMFVLRMGNADGSQVRSYFAHGIPDSWLANNKITNTGLAAYVAAAAPWLADLVLPTTFGVKRIAVPGAGTPITSISPLALGAADTIICAAPHGVPSGTLVKVQIRGYRGYPQRLANGIWTALANSTATFIMAGSAPLSLNNGPGGKVQVLSPTVAAITNVSRPNYGARKVGRPLPRALGRRSAALLHH